MTRKLQQLLLTSLIVAMILPFSSMQFTHADTTSYDKAKPILDEIERLFNTHPYPVYDSSSSSGVSSAKSSEGVKLAYTAKLNELRAELIKISTEERRLHALTPTKLAELMGAQEKISKSAIPWIGLSINDDKEILEIEIHEGYSPYRAQLRYLVDQIIDKPFELIFTLPMVLDSCLSQNSSCNPIIGGLTLHTLTQGDCTVGLPVKMIDGTKDLVGFITAGHCVNLNEQVHQPSTVYAAVGTVVKVRAACDCAFIEKAENTTINSATWQRYGVNSITSKVDPLQYDYVYMVGQKSGFKQGQIIKVNDMKSINGVNIGTVLKIKHFQSQHGDSGAPIISAGYGGTFHGMVSGHDLYTKHTYAIPWTTIDRELNLR